jgi:GntR family transcriptional regulator, transcriptional repressor for pyruvate dehydrogenase complex
MLSLNNGWGKMVKTLSNTIYNDIKRDVITGIYPVNSKLPPERELTVKYESSRFAVREAIAMLIQSGYVETHPQSGTFVKDFNRYGSLEMLVEVLRVTRELDRQTLESLLQFRYNTETVAAREAAGYISDNDIDFLELNLIKKKRNLGNLTVLTECDFDFHYRIITISRNIISQLVFKSFKPIYSFFTEFFYSLEGAPEQSYRLNMILVKALSEQDRDASGKAMSDLLNFAAKKVNDAIKNNKHEKIII